MSRRQSKSGTKRKRAKGASPKGEGEERYEIEGAMSSMVGGFRRAVGVQSPKRRSWLDHAWTILLVAAVVGVLVYRFLL